MGGENDLGNELGKISNCMEDTRSDCGTAPAPVSWTGCLGARRGGGWTIFQNIKLEAKTGNPFIHSPKQAPGPAALSLLVSCCWPGVSAALCADLNSQWFQEGLLDPPEAWAAPQGQPQAEGVKSQVPADWCDRWQNVQNPSLPLRLATAAADLPPLLLGLFPGLRGAPSLIHFACYDCGRLLDSVHQKASCLLVLQQLRPKDRTNGGWPCLPGSHSGRKHTSGT